MIGKDGPPRNLNAASSSCLIFWSNQDLGMPLYSAASFRVMKVFRSTGTRGDGANHSLNNCVNRSSPRCLAGGVRALSSPCFPTGIGSICTRTHVS